MSHQRRYGRRSIGREAQLVTLLEFDHERPQFKRKLEQLEEGGKLELAADLIHPLGQCRVPSRSSSEELRGRHRDRSDLFLLIQRGLPELLEDRVVVRDV